MHNSGETSGDRSQQHSLKDRKLLITQATPEISLGIMEKFLSKTLEKLKETKQQIPQKEPTINRTTTQVRPDVSPGANPVPNIPNVPLTPNPTANFAPMPAPPPPSQNTPQKVSAQKSGGQSVTVRAPIKPLVNINKIFAAVQLMVNALNSKKMVFNNSTNKALNAETNLERKLVREDQSQEDAFVEQDKKQEQAQVRLETLQEKNANKHDMEQKAESAPLHRKELSEDKEASAEAPRPSLGIGK